MVTLPALAALRAAFPGAVIHLLAHPAHGALAVADGLAEGFRSLESAGLAPFFAPDGVPGEEWREWMGAFDLVVSWLSGDVFREQVLSAGAGRFCQGPWRFAGGVPVAAQLAEALEPLGLVPAAWYHAFRFCAGARTRSLAVHPGSGSPRKNWPVASWLAFLRDWHARFPERDLLVITGEAERDDVLALPGLLRAAGVPCDHSHGAPLPEVCRLLASCRYYAGHDTGISHLAAACGTESVLIYGPGSPAQWEPPAPHVRICRTEDIPALPPRALFDFLPAGWLRD